MLKIKFGFFLNIFLNFCVKKKNIFACKNIVLDPTQTFFVPLHLSFYYIYIYIYIYISIYIKYYI